MNMQPDQPRAPWKPPVSGFEVAFRISSTVHNPAEITEAVGIQPTRVRYAKDEIKKYHSWQLGANTELATIQEQIDDVLARIGPYANKIKHLKDCDPWLSVFYYAREFELKNPGSHPSFNLSEEQIALLHSMNASFVVD